MIKHHKCNNNVYIYVPYVSKRLSNIKPIFSPSDEKNITDSQTDSQNDITYPYISYSLHDYLKN